MSQAEWWRGMPLWLKLTALFVAMPAWLFVGYCVLSDQNKSTAAYAAVAVFLSVTLLAIIFDRRKDNGRHEGGTGFHVGGD